jgi:hypothetical protein
MSVRNGVIIIFAWMLVGCASSGVTPTSTASEASPSAASPPSGVHAGLRVFIDPQSGDFTQPPVETATTTAPPERSFSRSHEGLTAVHSDVPGGGIRLDLQGRFRSHFIATKDADGKVSIHCLPTEEFPKP